MLRQILLLALPLFFGSCASSLNPCSRDPSINLVHEDPRCRCNGAIQAELESRHDLFPLMVENLKHANGDVRLITGTAIRKLSGIDSGYQSFGSSEEQKRAIHRWEIWWSNSQWEMNHRQEKAE